MKTFIGTALLTTTLLSAAGVAHAMPQILTELQMDQVSAGGQYSVVAGGGTAELGTVSARTDTKAVSSNGVTLTKAGLKVVALGTGLDAYGYGASDTGDSQSLVYGQASTDQGRLMILVRTMSMTKHNGDVMTKSQIHVATTGGGITAGAGASF